MPTQVAGVHTGEGTDGTVAPRDTMTQLPLPPGLSTAEAAARLRRDGPNVVPSARSASVLRELASQFTHLLAILLWVAAGFALLAGMPQLAVAIVVIVLLNGGFAFWQEFRADRSAQELQQLIPRRCRVVRDGAELEVPAADLVVDDLVVLQPGDRVAADLVVVRADGLRLDESLVTGESAAVEHEAGDALLAGSFVLQGEATATATATGRSTTLAGIAALTESAERPASPLSRQLARVVRVIAVVAVVTAAVLGVGGAFLGLTATEAFLFAVGVAVALVPEGLLPTVTLSLARGARLMADHHALVRRLDAVETLGATTYICTDKTGTLTQNKMSVVEVVTRAGIVQIVGDGYSPVGRLSGSPEALAELPTIAAHALAGVTGRVVADGGGGWSAEGDPMEAAIDCLAARAGVHRTAAESGQRRPFSPDRMVSSVLDGTEVTVLGAPEQVFARCSEVPAALRQELERLTGLGRRVLGVARRTWTPVDGDGAREVDLEPLGLLSVQDPPRNGVGAAIDACRRADIRVAMLTGDHPRTAEAVGRQIGLLSPDGLVVSGPDLPADLADLGALLDRDGGVVVARVTPADKFRIAQALRARGHVIAMTGDGVNDAPALREADVGVAMGASGSDVAREAADLVLLDDHFETIVTAVRLGRATFRNVRRFLTYHLTDNVAELTPFVVWALSAGQVPLAIGVLQVLALDIGTDMLPALALGTEPPSEGIMDGRHEHTVLDRALLGRAFGLLGATEAVTSLAAFVLVLVGGGWRWGLTPSPALLALASGTAFATISVAQMANAFACRSESRPVWRMAPGGNRLLLVSVGVELLLLLAFVGLPLFAGTLGGSWPSLQGWTAAVGAGVLLVLVDGLAKVSRRRRGWPGTPRSVG